jgi:hypothetical protein
MLWTAALCSIERKRRRQGRGVLFLSIIPSGYQRKEEKENVKEKRGWKVYEQP